MSTQKGANNRTRPQKHQNRTVFRNNLHDTSVRTKFINSIQVYGVCTRCKDIIDWKIKYKKYKPLTAPKTCVRCSQKTVKHAYHVICMPCGKKEQVCNKCCKKEEVVKLPEEPTAAEVEWQATLKELPERKRRTLLRYLKKQSAAKAKAIKDGEPQQADDDYQAKMEKLKLSIKANEDDDDLDLSDDDFNEDDVVESDDEK